MLNSLCINFRLYPMTSNLQAVRGTHDLLSEECEKFRFIYNKAFEQAQLYGYGEIMTPMFEFTEVFQRTLGDTSDIVSKEMYTFTDRGGDSITLRPEGTAGIARSFISEGMTQNIPVKFFYSGPMFRYERPQKGRYRQFYQMGTECLGIASPLADVESIALSFNVLKALGLNEKVQLQINTLGDSQSRQNYRDQLVLFFNRYKTELSKDSQERLEKNPLRILDSKDEKDQKFVLDAPKFSSSLSVESQKFIEAVFNGLASIGIPFIQNDRLVRGLDYYCHTVFEWTTSLLGAQSTVLGGGRYDGLIQTMGGPSTPGVGWASGVDRLALLLTKSESAFSKDRRFALIIAEELATSTALKISYQLRERGYFVEMPLSGNVGKKFKRADKVGCGWAVILGSKEILENNVSLKNLETGEQLVLPLFEFWNRFP